MKDVTPFSGASRKINNETKPTEHKTCTLKITRIWDDILGSWGRSLHLVKMSTVPEATRSSNVIPIKIMVAYFQNRKSTGNIRLPPQMTLDSKSV